MGAISSETWLNVHQADHSLGKLTLFEVDPAGFFKGFFIQEECWVHHHFEPEIKETIHTLEAPHSLSKHLHPLSKLSKNWRQRDYPCSGSTPNPSLTLKECQDHFIFWEGNGLISFWWGKGMGQAKTIVFIDYLQKGHTIYGKYYVNLLRCLCGK